MGTVTKGLAGKTDLSLWDGTSTQTFTRVTSDGYTMTLPQFDWVGVDVCKVYGGGTLKTGTVLSNAATAVGSTNQVAFFLSAGEWTISSNLALTSNIFLIIQPGTTVTINTGVTFSCYHIKAFPGQNIFTVNGTMTYYGDTLHGEWFGMNGFNDTCNADELTATGNAFSEYGGTLMVGNGRFRFDKKATITQSAVLIQGRSVYGKFPASNTAQAGTYFYPGADITDAMIEFTYYTGTSAIKGGGMRDISFVDIAWATPNVRRNYSVAAALYVNGCDEGVWENLSFYGIKGTAIKTARSDKNRWKKIDVVECGDTDLPGVYLSTSGSTGNNFWGMQIESNYLSKYLHIVNGASGNHFNSCRFETTDDVSDTWQTYVYDLGQRNTFNQIIMNKNKGTDSKFVVAGGDNVISNVISSGQHVGQALEITEAGTYTQVSNFKVTYAYTVDVEVYGIYCAADFCQFDNIYISSLGGGMRFTTAADFCTVRGFTHREGGVMPTATLVPPPTVDTGLYTIYDQGTHNTFSEIVSSGLKHNTAWPIVSLGQYSKLTNSKLHGSTTTSGAVYLGQSFAMVLNNDIMSIGSATNPAYGVATSANSVTINGNQIYGIYGHGVVVGADASATVYPKSIQNNLIQQFGVAAASTYDGISFRGNTQITGSGVISGNRIYQGDSTARYSIYMTHIAAGAVAPRMAIKNNDIDEGGVLYPSTAASATALKIPAVADWISVTGTTNITSMNVSYIGRIVTLVFSDVLTFTDGSNLVLDGNHVTSAGENITLYCDGTNWNEICRIEL